MEDNGIYRSLIDETRSPQKRSSLPPPKLLLTAILVALGGPFNFGYQLLITNPAQEAFLQFLNDSHFLNKNEYLEREQLEGRWSFIISIFFWGCTTGALLIRGLSEKFGRKNALQQTNAATYAIARFLLGFSITISLGTAPMFITECSPKECRGVTSLTNGVVLQVAVVVGAVLAMPQLFGTVEDWWKLYALELLLTIVVMIFVPFIHDSPGFLHSRGLGHASQRSLSFYHNIDGDALKLTIKQLEEENGNGQQFGLLSVWRDPASRRGTLIGAVVMLSMAMSGIAAINAFAFEILLSTGLSVLQASVGNIVICLMSVLGILTSSFVIDRFGRRILLLSTYSLLGIINIVIASLMFGFEYAKVVALGYPLLAAICVFNFVFAAGPGPVSLFITGELVGQSGRGAACTWVNVLMCLLRSLLTASYLPLKNLIGQPASYFLLFFPPMVFTVFLLYFFLPETKGKTPSEVEEEWDNLPTLCKSRANHEHPSVDLKV
ncbi:transporter, major facilitator family protein [Ancylostoma duodenale]|uniref:Transporter, major facilitator family protein n=1 Tax=Ancylostoma duodenale TaxID=51022 RepID=A0A0C2FIV1_9BILA|nr:transporter, major facilitator family protein [Ancylostoma duodenale]